MGMAIKCSAKTTKTKQNQPTHKTHTNNINQRHRIRSKKIKKRGKNMTFTHWEKCMECPKQPTETEDTISFCGKDVGWNFPPYDNLKFTWVKEGDKKILTLDTCDEEDI